MALGRKTGGRSIGTPNRATVEAREAMRILLDGNIHRLEEWLLQVAQGIKSCDRGVNGSPGCEYIVRPNPAKAFDLLHSLLEFYVPKLTRVQVTTASPSEEEGSAKVFDELLSAVRMMRQKGD